LFAGSLRAGQRAAAVMSLIQSAKLNGQAASGYALRSVPTDDEFTPAANGGAA